MHITRELLHAVSRGELPPRLLAQIGGEHLLHLCSHCRREWQAWQEERRPGEYDYSQVFQMLPKVIEHQAPRIAREQQLAERDLGALLALPEGERIQRIKRARNHFRGAALVELLMEQSRKQLHTEPRVALHLAELARTVVHHSPTMPGAFNLIALATAYMANAFRAFGELRQASEQFAHARYVISHEGVTDPEILARVDDLEGSLRKDQRLYKEAEELMNRAMMLYRLSRAKSEEVRVLLKLGSLYFYEGDVDRAIETVRGALRRLRREAEPRLFLCARHNLVTYLAEAGFYQQAADSFARDQDLYRGFPDEWTQLRYTWLQGRIAGGLGDLDTAEAALTTTREGFIARGHGFDAAQVSLDLAVLYARAGRTVELRSLAEEIAPIFEALDVHREALAALLLFQEAARKEALSLALLRDLRAYFREARADPSLRFVARPAR